MRLQERILFPLTEKQVFHTHITLGMSMAQLQPSLYLYVTKYKDWFILCKRNKPESRKPGESGRVDDIGVLLRSNLDVKLTLKAYFYAVLYNFKVNW